MSLEYIWYALLGMVSRFAGARRRGRAYQQATYPCSPQSPHTNAARRSTMRDVELYPRVRSLTKSSLPSHRASSELAERQSQRFELV